MRPTHRVELFGNIFTPTNRLGTLAVLLTFWKAIRIVSRQACKLNGRGTKNWRFGSIYLVSYGKRYKIMAIVIKEDDLELLCDLSNGAIFNDLE